MALVDYFMKIDGVAGESMDAKHRDEIQVLAFRWAEKSPRDVATGQAHGRIHMDPFKVTMNVNKASPKLFLMCAQGTVSPKIIFTARKAGAGQQDYLRLTLLQACVSDFELESEEDTDQLPTNRLEFTFRQMEIEYLQQKADGTLSGPIKGKFNLDEMQSK